MGTWHLFEPNVAKHKYQISSCLLITQWILRRIDLERTCSFFRQPIQSTSAPTFGLFSVDRMKIDWRSPRSYPCGMRRGERRGICYEADTEQKPWTTTREERNIISLGALAGHSEWSTNFFPWEKRRVLAERRVAPAGGQDTEGPRSWTPSAQPAQDCNSVSTVEDRPLTHYGGHSSLSIGLWLESPRHHVSRCVHEGLSRDN